MALNLNEIQKYKEFYGSNLEQMPLLVNGKNKEGKQVDVPRTPMPFAVLMERRVNSQLGDWRDNYFYLGDGIAYSTRTNFKVALDALQLRSINPKTKLQNGALILGDEDYKTADGEEFDRSQIILERPLTKTEAKAHPVLLALARGDKSLLNAYVDKTFADAKQKFNYDENMGLYLASPQKVSTMRAFFVSWLEAGSDVGGWGALGNVDGRLVGLAPEALGAKSLVIPETRIYTIADVQKTKKELDELTQVRPELLKETRSLVGKL